MKNDLLVAFILSVIGFVVSWLLGIIPYAGVFLALVIQFPWGYAIGWIDMPRWLIIPITLSTEAGLTLGFFQGTYAHSSSPWPDLVAVVSGCLFVFGLIIGYRQSGKAKKMHY